MATAVFKPYRDYSTMAAQFHYRTVQDTAVPGRDYNHVEGDITIPVGATSIEIPVEIVDKLPNRLPRSFFMEFSSKSQGVMIGTQRAKCTIVSDENLDRISWDTVEERMFHPRYWVTTTQQTESTCIVADNNCCINRLVSRTYGGMAGCIWETVDKYDHFGIGFDDHYEMRNTKLWFRMSITNASNFSTPEKMIMTVDLVDGTIIYVPLAQYAVSISEDKNVAEIHIDFEDCVGMDQNNNMMGVDPRQVRRILIPLMPKDWVSNSTDPRTENVECELRLDLLQPDTGWKMMQLNNIQVKEHDVGICTAYDDMWNVSPLRVLNNIKRLGYTGTINHYVGMSHYYDYTWSGTQWSINRTGALNAAAYKWHDNFMYNAKRHNFDVMQSVSFELFSDACPLEWTQRDWNDNYAKTGYTPCSYLLSPTIEEGMNFLTAVFKNFASAAMRNNLPVIMQVGEPWWWYNTDTRRPCIYDYPTKQAFYDETGEYALDIGTIDDPKTGGVYDKYVAFCRGKLGARIAAISKAIKAHAASAQMTALLFFPTIMETELTQKLNLADQYKKEAGALDFFCTECYDWVMQGGIEKAKESVNIPIVKLGWQPSEIQYLAGFVPSKELAPVYGYDPTRNYQEFLWRCICGNMATIEYRYPEVKQYVWAYPQVMSDSITVTARDSTVLHMGQVALKGYVEDVVPPDFS